MDDARTSSASTPDCRIMRTKREALPKPPVVKSQIINRFTLVGAVDFATSTASMIADAMVDLLRSPVNCKPVEAGGAERAARMLADLL